MFGRGVIFFREALIKSSRVDSEIFFVKPRFGKRRNTGCLSSFPNRKIGGKDSLSAAEDFFRVSLVIQRFGQLESGVAADGEIDRPQA